MKLSDINPKIITAAVVGFIAIVFIALVVSLFVRPAEEEDAAPAVASSSPQNQSEGVILTLPITVSFAEDLDTGQQANVSFTIQPGLDVLQEWTNAAVLQLALTQLPESSTTYTVTVLYKKKAIYSFTFTTTAETPEELTEAGRVQAEEDFLFAQEEKEFYKTYPWYGSIPIRTDDYVIVYNFEKEAFRISLTLGENPLGAQIEAAKTRALDSLEAIGVDLNVYDYYVLID